jgi:hypothetical protein
MLAEAVDRARTARVDITEAVDAVATTEGHRLAAEIDTQLRSARPRGCRAAVASCSMRSSVTASNLALAPTEPSSYGTAR